MKMVAFAALALGAWASMALAETLPPTGGAKGSVAAEAAPAGPVALTEAEMDKVAAGARVHATSSKVAVQTSVYQKKWLPSNFRFDLGDLP